MTQASMGVHRSWPPVPLSALLLALAGAGCGAEVPQGDEIIDPWSVVAPCELAEQVDAVVEARIEADYGSVDATSRPYEADYAGATCEADDVPSLTVVVAIDLVETTDDQKLYHRVQGDPELNSSTGFRDPQAACGGRLEIRTRRFADQPFWADVERDLVTALAACGVGG